MNPLRSLRGKWKDKASKTIKKRNGAFVCAHPGHSTSDVLKINIKFGPKVNCFVTVSNVAIFLATLP